MAALHVAEAELEGNLRAFLDQVRLGGRDCGGTGQPAKAILKPVADAPRTMSEIIAAMEAGGLVGWLTKTLRAMSSAALRAVASHGTRPPRNNRTGSNHLFGCRFQGLVVDSSVLINAERGNIATPDVVRNFRQAAGDVPIVICRTDYRRIRPRRLPRHDRGEGQISTSFSGRHQTVCASSSITGATAEIIARVSGERAVRGITVPVADLIIGACALELGYAVATHNVRHFQLIPGLYVRQV